VRERARRLDGSWIAELATCACAALLAFATLAWEEGLHFLALGLQPAGGGSHLLRDGLLLLPPALVAVWWGVRLERAQGLGVGRVAAAVSLAFVALLAPAAAGHSAVHATDLTAAVQAQSRPAHAGPAAQENPGGLVEALQHGALDALLALPVTFVLSLGAIALLRRWGRGTSLDAVPRRLVLVVSALAVLGAAAAVPVGRAASPAYPKFSMPLSIPPVLTGANINLSMAESEQQILPGEKTRLWTYNGTFPGPIIRRPTGVPTKVTLTNNLPASAGSMTMHHHGAQTTEESDGQPSSYLVAPGASKTYTYPGIDNGAPERAAPQWYHDHRDMVTGRNVWMGLAGAFIYDDPVEQNLNLPKDEYDLPLMVADREFDSRNQIPYTFLSNGVFGDVLLVNGVPQPFHEVGDRRYRLRLYNISNKRDYSFRLSNGQSMTQIGTDSGLLPAPVSRTSIRLGPAERADVVIDFAGRLGENVVLENADHEFGPGERDAEVMQFRVTQDVPETSSAVPATLRPVPGTGTPVSTRTWSFDRTAARWTINGKVFDPDRVDAKPTLGSTERWVFRNPTTQAHLVHTHLGDQKLVSRNGQPPGPSERLKDSWHVAPGEEVVVDVKFTDYAGKFVLHCHVLEHEDDGMMTQFETVQAVAAPSYPRPPGGSGSTTKPPPTSATLSRRIKILSSKRLSRILRRGLRFEAAVPAPGTTLRAALSVRGRRIGTVRRRGLSRGRVKVTLKLSRRGKARLRRLMAQRRRASALLEVSAGTITARVRFTIRR